MGAAGTWDLHLSTQLLSVWRWAWWLFLNVSTLGVMGESAAAFLPSCCANKAEQASTGVAGLSHGLGCCCTNGRAVQPLYFSA